MKILLIQPCPDSHRWKNEKSKFSWPPIGLGYIAACTPKEHQVEILDETFKKPDFDTDADLIGISIMTATALRGYELADEFRKRGKPVVLGGIHASMMPEEAIQHCDSVVIGEAEEIWKVLLEDFKNRNLQKKYVATPPDISNQIGPRRDLFNSKYYKIPYTVMATRGCPHGCSFCSTTKFFGKAYRKRNPDLVFNEIKSFNKNFFIFVDDNLVVDRNYAISIFKLIGPLRKKFVCQATIKSSEDKELLFYMKKAGCIGVLIGIESLNQNNISYIGKGINVASEYREKIKIFHKAGLFVQGSFVFGFDNDTLDSFKEVCKFVSEMPLIGANFCVLTPLPGTKIYESMERENRLLHKDWEKYTRLNVVFKPLNLTPEELQNGVVSCYLKTYSISNIFKRLPFFQQNFFLSLGYNFAYRSGVYKEWKNFKPIF